MASCKGPIESQFAHKLSWDVKRLNSLGNSEFLFLLSSVAKVRITPRFSSHISRFDLVFIELKSLLGLEDSGIVKS